MVITRGQTKNDCNHDTDQQKEGNKILLHTWLPDTNHSTVVFSPSINSVVDSHPSSFFAFDPSANKRSGSPGRASLWTILAFLPISFSNIPMTSITLVAFFPDRFM